MPDPPTKPEDSNAPIPSSYYASAPLEPPEHLDASAERKSVLRGVPGFRSRTPWKEIAAAVGYVLILILILVGFGNLSDAILGWSALGAVLLISNAWGTRDRVPVLRSSNKLVAAGGWATIALVILVSAGLAAPAQSSSSGQRPATAHSSSAPEALARSASPSAKASPSPKPSPSVSASPSPSQSAAAPAAPLPPPPPPPPPPTGVNGNPWGYDFNPGNYITAPPSAFCTYFNCIASFWSGHGYVMECVDTTYSLSGGIQGSCSHHGGNYRPLYSH
jgi:hypothetical protein